MTCLICDSPAQIWDIAQGDTAADCPGCGRYDISGSVIAVMRIRGFRLDVKQMREWLASQREIYPDAIPFIRDGNPRWAL